MMDRASFGTSGGMSNGRSPDDVASISGHLAGALATSIGRAIRNSVDAWKRTAAPDLARRVRAWRGGKDRGSSGSPQGAGSRDGSESLKGLARELAALRCEFARRERASTVDPGALADQIASVVATHLGGRLGAGSPPPPPSAAPRERDRIPFDDIAGIVDRLIQGQY